MTTIDDSAKGSVVILIILFILQDIRKAFQQ